MSAMTNGHHFEAFLRQENLYRDTCAQVRAASGRDAISVLDYGCGAEKGVSRTILESILEQRDMLHLYDAEEVKPSRRPNTRVISDALIWTANPVRSDIVNLSYVLCLLPPEDARMLLKDLKMFQPGATFCIVDYTLREQTRENVLRLLSSREEEKWKEKLGTEEFLRTHMRFAKNGIADLAESAELRVTRTLSLDSGDLRGAVVAEGR